MDMPMQLHLAAQYLATTGISFLEKKEDDSHTNLEFSTTEKRLATWPLDENGTQLGLHYPTFSLQWISTEVQSLPLDGKSHNEVVMWLKEASASLSPSKNYEYNLHYELPYVMKPDESFQLTDSEKIEKLIQLRTMANVVLAQVLADNDLSSDIRIWPHHFDTGAFSELSSNTKTAVGLGLSIPDSLVDDYYFYISGYHGHTALDTSSFSKLNHGTWLNDGFKGAVLPASSSNAQQAISFFNEAIQAYIS